MPGGLAAVESAQSACYSHGLVPFAICWDAKARHGDSLWEILR